MKKPRSCSFKPGDLVVARTNPTVIQRVVSVTGEDNFFGGYNVNVETVWRLSGMKTKARTDHYLECHFKKATKKQIVDAIDALTKILEGL